MIRDVVVTSPSILSGTFLPPRSPPYTHSAPGTSLPSAFPLPIPALIFSAMTSEDSLLPPACPLYTPSIPQIYSFGVFGEWPCLLGRVQHDTPPAVEIFTCRRASAPASPLSWVSCASTQCPGSICHLAEEQGSPAEASPWYRASQPRGNCARFTCAARVPVPSQTVIKVLGRRAIFERFGTLSICFYPPAGVSVEFC